MKKQTISNLGEMLAEAARNSKAKTGTAQAKLAGLILRTAGKYASA